MTTVPGMAWVKHTRSSGCRFTVCIIIERLTSFGVLENRSYYKNSTKFWGVFLRMNAVFHRPNDSRMLVALGESYEKLSQQAEAKKVGDSSQ